MFKKTNMYIICLLFFAAVSGCKEKIDPGVTKKATMKSVKARVAVASVNPQASLYEAVGTVSARTSSTLSGKLMGTVKAVNVREGDSVKKEDILIEIDERQVTSQLKKTEAGVAESRRALTSAESSMDSAKAGAALAKSTYDRYKTLLKEESVSQQEFEEVEAKHRQAAAALAQAEAMVEAARNRVEQASADLEDANVRKKDATIRAPYDGKITEKMVEVGDLASPGTPFLTIEQEGAFCVSLVVPEQHIRSVTLGQKVQVTIPSLQEKTVEGTVGRIDPAADQKSRSFQIKVALPESEAYSSGTFARVQLPVGEAGMMRVPLTAMVTQGQLTGYYLVDKNHIAHFRLMRPGRIYGDSVEVISGLKAGDTYVVDPPPEIENGVTVEVPHE
jgi:multidrug efflux pump subunit AcrA (membrane-fusion protein)